MRKRSSKKFTIVPLNPVEFEFQRSQRICGPTMLTGTEYWVENVALKKVIKFNWQNWTKSLWCNRGILQQCIFDPFVIVCSANFGFIHDNWIPNSLNFRSELEDIIGKRVVVRNVSGDSHKIRQGNSLQLVTLVSELRVDLFNSNKARFGSASWTILGLHGFSWLEGQLQDWHFLKNSLFSDHDAVGRGSWESEVSWRIDDIPNSWRDRKSFSTRIFGSCRRGVGMTTNSHEEGRLRAWSTSIFVQPAHEAEQGLTDLFTFRLQNYDVQDFNVRWDQALLLTATNNFPTRSWKDMFQRKHSCGFRHGADVCRNMGKHPKQERGNQLSGKAESHPMSTEKLYQSFPLSKKCFKNRMQTWLKLFLPTLSQMRHLTKSRRKMVRKDRLQCWRNWHRWIVHFNFIRRNLLSRKKDKEVFNSKIQSLHLAT